MGNRAVIAFGKSSDATGIYLHWNGGRASVEGFLSAAKELGVRSNDDYAPARLCQIIGNWFGGTLSVGVAARSNLDCDNGDNGVYVIGDRFNIIDREYAPRGEEVNAEKTAQIAAECVAKSREFFVAKEAA